MTNIKQAFETACNAYLKAFCEKHGYDYESCVWIDMGNIVDIADYCVDLNTIRIDIDKEAPEKEFVKWYDYTLRLGMVDHEISTPNFESWLKGCPRRSEEEILELEGLHEQVRLARERLEECVDKTAK